MTENELSKVKKIQGSIANYFFDEDGIFHIVTKSIPHTLENTTQDYELIRQICGDQKVCAIIDATKADIATKEIRNYVRAQFPCYFKAIAFTSQSAVGKLASSLIFVDQQTQLLKEQAFIPPMKICSSELEARMWLKGYL